MSDSSTASDTRGVFTAIPLLPGRTLIGFVAAVAAVIFMALFSYRSLEARSNAATLVTQTLRTMEGLEAFMRQVLNAEVGQRGYLLTSEESYLAPYTAARAELPGMIANLRSLIGDAKSASRFD